MLLGNKLCSNGTLFLYISMQSMCIHWCFLTRFDACYTTHHWQNRLVLMHMYWVQTCSSQSYPTPSKAVSKAPFTAQGFQCHPSNHRVPGSNVTTIDLRIVVRAHPTGPHLWSLRWSSYIDVDTLPYGHPMPCVDQRSIWVTGLW